MGLWYISSQGDIGMARDGDHGDGGSSGGKDTNDKVETAIIMMVVQWR